MGGKGSKGGFAAAVLEGTTCPVCGKGKLQESPRAFSCTEASCRCTLWKDCLTRGGGPVLTEKLIRLLLAVLLEAAPALEFIHGVERLLSENAVRFAGKVFQGNQCLLHGFDPGTAVADTDGGVIPAEQPAGRGR